MPLHEQIAGRVTQWRLADYPSEFPVIGEILDFARLDALWRRIRGDDDFVRDHRLEALGMLGEEVLVTERLSASTQS